MLVLSMRCKLSSTHRAILGNRIKGGKGEKVQLSDSEREKSSSRWIMKERWNAWEGV